MIQVFTYELKRQFKQKANIIYFSFAFSSFTFIQFVYIYLIGPIGIFSDSHIMKLLVRGYGTIVSIVPMDNSRIIQSFSQSYSMCNDAVAQLAREYMDSFGVTFYFGSFLIGSFALTKEQQEKDKILLNNKILKPSEYVIAKYLAVVAYSLFIAASFILLPFILSFRLEKLGYTGNPVAYWRYFLLW